MPVRRPSSKSSKGPENMQSSTQSWRSVPFVCRMPYSVLRPRQAAVVARAWQRLLAVVSPIDSKTCAART
jgi:hypothetical protein